MARPNYEIPENPIYDPVIPALIDEDPASATEVFNPLVQRLITNTHAVRNDLTLHTHTASDIDSGTIDSARLPLATTNPVGPGTASVGTLTTVARANHVHPRDATATVAEAEAGTSATVRSWTPQRVRQAINAVVSTLILGGDIPATVTQTEAETGTSTDVRSWTPERVRQAINAVVNALTHTSVGAAPQTHNHNASDINAGTIAAARLPALPTQAQAEAGTETTARLWSSQRVRQAIDAVVSGLTIGGDIPATATQAEAEAGTSANIRSWTPQRVRQASDSAIANQAIVTQAVAEAGADTARAAWTSQRVRQAINAVVNALSPVGLGAAPLTHTHHADHIENGTIAAARLPALPTQAQAEAGTETTARLWSSERVRQAINAVVNALTYTHLNAAPATHTHHASDIDNGIIAAARLPAIPTQAQAEAGTEIIARLWTAQRVRQAANSAIANQAIVTQAVAEAGTATTRAAWTAQRVRQAINAVVNALTYTHLNAAPATHTHNASDIDNGIIAAARLPALPTQAQAIAGTETTARLWSSERVRQAASAVANAVVNAVIRTPVHMVGNVVSSYGNLFIGDSAGASWTGSGFSTLIGASAGHNITIASNTTCLGNGAVPPNGTTHNTITLGNNQITALRCQVTTIMSLSDPRVKEYHEHANIEKCFKAVKNLPVSRYKYKDFTGTRLDKNVLGFMADDMEKVFPKSVSITDYHFPLYNESGEPITEDVEVEREIEFVVINGEEIPSDDLNKINNILADIQQEQNQRIALQAALKQRLDTMSEIETSEIEKIEAEIEALEFGASEIVMPDINSFPRIRKKVKVTEQRQKTHFLPDVKEITPTELVPALWGAVQFLSEKVEKLEVKVENLENQLLMEKVERLETRIAELENKGV